MPVSPTKRRSAPAKKPKRKAAKKRSVKKDKKKASRRAIERGIKQAIERIPGLFVEHVDFDQKESAGEALENFRPHEPASFAKPPAARSYMDRSHTQKRRLMWAGVFSLTLVVFVMWIWNTHSVFYDIRYTKNNIESELYTNAKDDLRTIMKTIGSPENDDIARTANDSAPKELTEDRIRETLTESLRVLLASTTSTSSTIDIPPSHASSTSVTTSSTPA